MTRGKPAKPDTSLDRPTRGHHCPKMGKHHGHVEHMKHAAHAELVKKHAVAAKKHLEQVQATGVDKTVGELTHDVSERAAQYAAAARDWTAPRVEAAIDWASPRAQDAYRRTMRAAAPKVKVAADRIEPLVDTAHDKIVDEILPGIVEAVATAAASAGYAAEEASRRTKDAAKVIKGEAVVVPVKKKHTFRKVVLWVGITATVAAVGYAAYQRLRPLDDPWAEDDWANDEDDPVVSTTATSLKDAAAAAKENATSATDAAIDAAKDAAKKTTSAAKRAADEA